MKKAIVIPLLVLLAASVLLAGKGVSVLRESGSKADALVNADIDMSRLSDGVYTGSCGKSKGKTVVVFPRPSACIVSGFLLK